MVQEANVKRAQAEKALAESEMKVRSEPRQESVVHVVSESGCYTSSDDSGSVGITFSQILNIWTYLTCISINWTALIIYSATEYDVLYQGCCQLFVAQFHSFCFSWNYLLHNTKFLNQTDRYNITAQLVHTAYGEKSNAIWHYLCYQTLFHRKYQDMAEQCDIILLNIYKRRSLARAPWNVPVLYWCY